MEGQDHSIDTEGEREGEGEGAEGGGEGEGRDISVLHMMINSVSEDSQGLTFLVIKMD